MTTGIKIKGKQPKDIQIQMIFLEYDDTIFARK